MLHQAIQKLIGNGSVQTKAGSKAEQVQSGDFRLDFKGPNEI